MEYRWEPDPHMAADYAYLNPQLDEHDRARQQAGIYREKQDWAGAAKVYRELVREDPRQDLLLETPEPRPS